MDPLLWGPCLWKTLFSISFNCKHEDLPTIIKLLKLLERVLPCPTCRNHYIFNREQCDNLFPIKKNTENVRFWMWHMKSLVNKTTKDKNTDYKYIELRYKTFGHMISDLELVDVLMLMSLYIEKESDGKKFLEFLFTLGTLLNSFLPGQLSTLLQCVENINSCSMLKIVNSVRFSFGHSYRDIKHYLNVIQT